MCLVDRVSILAYCCSSSSRPPRSCLLHSLQLSTVEPTTIHPLCTITQLSLPAPSTVAALADLLVYLWLPHSAIVVRPLTSSYNPLCARCWTHVPTSTASPSSLSTLALAALTFSAYPI